MRVCQTFSILISFIENISNICISKKIIIKIYSMIYLMILIMYYKYKYSFIYNWSNLKIFNFSGSENDILCERGSIQFNLVTFLFYLYI